MWVLGILGKSNFKWKIHIIKPAVTGRIQKRSEYGRIFLTCPKVNALRIIEDAEDMVLEFS